MHLPVRFRRPLSLGIVRPVRWGLPVFLLLALLLAGRAAATAATSYTASDEASLRNAIFAVSNDFVTGSSGNGPYTISISADITLTNHLPMIRGLIPADPAVTQITIQSDTPGVTRTIDGNNACRAFFVESGRVLIQEIAVVNVRATGGGGGSGQWNFNYSYPTGSLGGGGGGLGAGAALFVDDDAEVTVSRFQVNGTAASVGGNGAGSSREVDTNAASGGGGGLHGAGGSAGYGTFAGGGGGGYFGMGGSGGVRGGGGGGGEFGQGGRGPFNFTRGFAGGSGGGGQQGDGEIAQDTRGGNGGNALNGGGTEGGIGATSGPGGDGSTLGGGGGGGWNGGGGATNGGTGGVSGGGGGGLSDVSGATQGSGGAGGFGGGGGGGGLNGGAGGRFGGGGGGTQGSGGAGGYGGGGGGAYQGVSSAGVGGFGGGGGGGTGGTGGAYGGDGGDGYAPGGGGGAALGGAIFVGQAGKLTIEDSSFAGAYSVTPGPGGTGLGGDEDEIYNPNETPGNPGQALGKFAFLDTGTATRFMVTSGHTVTIPDEMAGPGGIVKDGAGTLKLTQASTYTGTTKVSAGTLEISDVGTNSVVGTGVLTIDPGATLTGYGHAKNDVVVKGTLAFGAAGTAITIEGDGQLGGPVKVNIAGPTTFNTFTTTGAVAYYGSLEITFTDYYVAAPGSTFKLINSTGRSGTFTSVTATNPDYTLSFDANTGTLTVLSAPAPQSISFDALTPVLVTDAPFGLAAVSLGGSTAPLTFSSSNPAVATVSGSTVTPVGVGTTTITASRGGSPGFAPARPVEQVLTVLPIPQTITFIPLPPVLVGGSSFELAATTTSGLPITYTSSNPAVATISGSTVTIVGPGTTTITAQQDGGGNYAAAASVPQDLTVKKTQAITFDAPAPVLVGSAPFDLTATASSGLAVSYASTNLGVATVSGNTVTIVGVGSTTITATQDGDIDYAAAAPVEQTLSVNAAPQTITFPALGSVSLGSQRVLGATASSGLPVTYSLDSGTATLVGNTITFTTRGAVTIRASQAGNALVLPAPDVLQTVQVTESAGGGGGGGSVTGNEIYLPLSRVTSEAGIQSVTLSILRNEGVGGSSSIDYNTANGTALAGVDYTATTGTLTFAAGVKVLAITVPLLPGATSGRVFTLQLSSPVNATVRAPGLMSVTIIGAPPPSLFQAYALYEYQLAGSYFASGEVSKAYLAYAYYFYFLYLDDGSAAHLSAFYENLAIVYFINYREAGDLPSAYAWYNYVRSFAVSALP